MMRFLALSILAFPAAAAPVPPALFHCADPSLEVTVWASSPMFNNPTNIDIDQHGRIWVAEGVNYRKHFNRRPEGDRIMVLEDTDKDGTADKSWCFVQEKFLRAPLGVAVIGNRVVVSMAPDLIVYTDKDGDAVFDAAKGDTREVLLTGFNGRNHDHSLHSVTAGPDGKWYFSCGNCGAKFTDKSGKTFRIAAAQNWSWWPKDPDLPDWDPNTVAGQKSDDGKVYVGGFIARMNPDGTNVEILAHNLRNSYENCVTSFGDIFASDNDDQPACRVFWLLEGGNYGFASADGQRSWQADRRPGQSVQTATWRQDDPGVAPAGDIYGGGAPTGCVFYENGALGPQHEGTLLVCESARNTIFGYKPKPEGAGWKLERFNFLTTNAEGKVSGTDYSGGDQSARADDTKTLFRPSDIAIGPDGALYISDWYDARTGGHNDLDDSVSGTIYRVAPKGFKSVVPKVDLSTVEGAIATLKSPAVHVRALAGKALKNQPWKPIESLVLDKNRYFAARGIWNSGNLPKLPRYDHHDTFEKTYGRPATNLISRWFAANRESLALATRERTDEEKFTELAERIIADSATFAACEWAQVPPRVYDIVSTRLGASDPLQWPPLLETLSFQSHLPRNIAAFKTRALTPKLSTKSRLDALTAIGFNDTKEAAEAMLDVAVKTDGSKDPLIRTTALWWLLNRKDSTWKAHGLTAALKEKGLYDPDKIVLVSFSTPEPPPPAFTVADALKLTGDAKRGEEVVARCYLCHKVGSTGAEFGPDLSTWGRTQTMEVLLRSMIEPSADIAQGFAGTRLELKDGTLIDGLLLTDADPLIIQSQGGVMQMVPRAKLKTKTALNRSLMLSATQQGLTAQEAADAAAFLRAR